jgi:hypothetical protein
LDAPDGGGGGVGAGSGSALDGGADILDDMDALGYGASGSDALPTAGMGSAATLRVQKARIAALSSNVSELTAALSARDKELSDLKALLKSSSDAREKLTRKHAAEEKAHAALQRQADDSAARAAAAETKVSSLERELAAAKKRSTEQEQETKTKDAKLNRALAELERTKEMAAKTRGGGGGGGGGGGAAGDEQTRELAALKAANKKLLSQRADLLTGFRRQARLVELLRKQKLHVEMAKMLQFAEDEFARSIDMGEV